MPIYDPPEDPVAALTKALSDALPHRVIRYDDVKERLETIKDLFDPCALYDQRALRAAMRFDRIFTIKQWTVEIDDRLHDDAVRKLVEDQVKKRRWLQEEIQTYTLYLAFSNWARMHPSDGNYNGIPHKRKVGTVRIQHHDAPGRLLWRELSDRCYFLTDFRHFSAFVGKYFRNLQKNRPVMITPWREMFDCKERPLEQLLVTWNGHDELRAEIRSIKWGTKYAETLPWTEADILVTCNS